MSIITKYLLITPARDEAEFIEQTIKCVVAQTIQPIKWVIVSDGSTDGTDEIVSKYANLHPWIQLIRVTERRERHFGGKARAFNAGYATIKNLEYEAVASLDADLTFDEEYFSFLLAKLNEDSALGVVGTPFRDTSVQAYDYRFVGIDHVSGACQMFRRECFEQIGGYVPVKGGGVDFIAILTARMKGWKTRTFVEKECFHHRHMGTAQQGLLKARYRVGVKDYMLGSHPLWQVLRTVFQMKSKPFVVGGVAMALGYLGAMLRREERPITREMIAFRRRQQMQRLRGVLAGLLPGPITKMLGNPKKSEIAQTH